MFGFKAVNHDFSAFDNFKYTIGDIYTLTTKPRFFEIVKYLKNI